MKTGRIASALEVKEIAQDIVRLHKLDKGSYNYLDGLENKDLMKDALLVLEGRTILITDDYSSDCPSYNGKAGVIFWGEVTFLTILVTDKEGKMRLMENENVEVSGGKGY